ncbi:MAG: Spo0B domain-containing protein [bacterium]|nr:Spo0B domain-containing protein [bacterium]
MGAGEQALIVLRAWRHELANDLQSITGWLQVGRGDRALEVAWAAADRLHSQGALLHLKAPSVALTLLEARARARRNGITLGLNLGSDLSGLGQEAEFRLAEAISRLLEEALAQQSGEARADLNLVVAEDSGGYRFDLESQGPVATLRWPRGTA